MYRLLVLLCLLMAAPGTHAQRPATQPELPRDLVTGLVSYRRVVVAEAFGQEQLYERARQWLRQNHHSPAGAPVLEDTGKGQLVAQGEESIPVRGSGPAVVRHTLTFQFRKGKFQYEFTNFSASGWGEFENDSPTGSKRRWNRLRAATDSQVKDWVFTLERDMLLKSKEAGDF